MTLHKCATAGCRIVASRTFKAGDVESWYCEECYCKVVDLAWRTEREAHARTKAELDTLHGAYHSMGATRKVELELLERALGALRWSLQYVIGGRPLSASTSQQWRKAHDLLVSSKFGDNALAEAWRAYVEERKP